MIGDSSPLMLERRVGLPRVGVFAVEVKMVRVGVETRLQDIKQCASFGTPSLAKDRDRVASADLLGRTG